ncbi:hypothetical protein HDU76_004746 [Blyttiomyces sp. JEL0837]|nr:hypothetical protein HDU76_004746 [Blyttiomyces sp. JEL0837]
MQIIALLSAIAAVATTLVSASPIETVVEKKLGGVQYASHVKFAGQLSKRNTPPPSGGGGKLVYNGGPIIANVEVTPLLWGSGVQYSSQLTGFYSAITDSSYYDMLSQYSTSSQTLGRGTATQPITLRGYPTSSSLDNDNDIVPYLTSLVRSGVIPDQGGSCAGGCGSSSNAFSNLCSVSSHELVEATTDPAIGVVSGNTIAAPAAWYDSADGNNGGEIGDLCNGQQGTAAGYTVQLEWSNSAGGCVAA